MDNDDRRIIAQCVTAIEQAMPDNAQLHAIDALATLRRLSRGPHKSIWTEPLEYNDEGIDLPRAVYEGDELLGYLCLTLEGRVAADPMLRATLGWAGPPKMLTFTDGCAAFAAILRAMGRT